MHVDMHVDINNNMCVLARSNTKVDCLAAGERVKISDTKYVSNERGGST
jgi:hypothetical protein